MSGLLASSLVVGVAAPAPLLWTETPIDVGNAVLYETAAADGEQWSVGIALEQEPGGPALKFHPLALRRTGASWQPAKLPVPDGRLDDVLVRSRSEAWAVGATEDFKNGDRAVLLRWDGAAWQRIDAPEPPPDTFAQQFTAIGPGTSGLLVGHVASPREGDGYASVLSYAAGNWQELPRDGLQHLSYVDDLEQISEKEIWAAGIGGIARFDGTAWQEVKLPIEIPEGRKFQIAELVVRGPDDIWAIGEKPTEEYWRQPLALHFDGKTWTEIPAPIRTGQFHDLDFVDGKAIAVGGDPSTGAPLVAELSGAEFVLTTPPPGAGYQHGSYSTGACLWTVGVAGAAGLEQPYAAVGRHQPDAGHGLPEPPCTS